MHFTKMHGIGNDYIYVDGLREKIADPSAAAASLSDRHFGIGSDGLILINPSDSADFEMEMYNADGSRGKMCGNGIRCVGKYVYDHGLTKKKHLTIETLSGIRTLDLIPGDDGKIRAARVDMGAPCLRPEKIPMSGELLREAGLSARDDVIDLPYRFGGAKYRITALSMGNPHCVIFLEEDVRDFDLQTAGKEIGKHPLFPEGVNVEFVNVLSQKHVRMRVYERGSGETMACGTGACAAAAASFLNGKTGRDVTVSLLGGDLEISFDEVSGTIFMTGPAKEVFEGDVTLLPDAAESRT